MPMLILSFDSASLVIRRRFSTRGLGGEGGATPGSRVLFR